MTVPIFNSLYYNNKNKIIKTKKLNIKLLNNLNLEHIDHKRYPAVKIIKKLNDKDSLFETVIVAANDRLVHRFLNNDIKFIEISKILLKILSLKEFTKYKKISPRKLDDIYQLSKLVSFKIDTLSI